MKSLLIFKGLPIKTLWLVAVLAVLPLTNVFATSSCTDIRAKLFSEKTQKSQIEQILDKQLSNLTNEERTLFLRGLESLEKPYDIQSLKSFLIFIESLKTKVRATAFADMAELYASEPSSKVIKKFQNLRKVAQRGHQKEISRVRKKLTRQNANDQRAMSKSELDSLVARQTKHYFRDYEKLVYQCSSTKSNDIHKAAAKKYGYFAMAVGAAVGTGVYTYKNWDSEESRERWWGRISYEVTYGVIMKVVSSWILSRPGVPASGKGGLRWLWYQSMGLIFDVHVYDSLFGTSSEEIQARVDKFIEENPDKVEELIKQLDDRSWLENVKETIVEGAKPMVGDLGGFLKEMPGSESIDVNWSKLTEEDLERADVQALLLKAMTEEIYEEDQGLINSGSLGSDLYIYHMGYGLAMTPFSLYTGLKIYNVFCTGLMNPAKAYLYALGLYAIEKAVSETVYRNSRPVFVGNGT